MRYAGQKGWPPRGCQTGVIDPPAEGSQDRLTTEDWLASLAVAIVIAVALFFPV